MRYLLILLGVVAGVVAVARRRLVVVQVSGQSMLPTYRPGDRVLVRRVAGAKLGRGQVAVFESAQEGRWRTGPLPAPKDARWLIKRVAALPGDPVPPEVARAVDAPEGALVPGGRLVVIGDGSLSADSRHWGYLPADRVLGVVVRRLSSS
ncbi:signal peptidase I [Nonomuraea coxensis DSM 45129]|uniref:Signal peptidase I n=1 Tax=Nonomuraea coxensis DSM 45129 TaxID=1122611 RepID=A0ABX8U8Z8_9ACTN|nr:S26 family signal peptidase [Nonomuraea coxensis]QYC44224.1 signal peptidase I [Nonomuraea coxensis DSM 45129]